MIHWLAVLFSLLLAGIFLLEQYYLYGKVKKYFAVIKAKRWQTKGVAILFILFNLPLLVIAVWRPRLSTLPYWFIVTGVIPFYVWHASLFAMFLLLMIGKVIKFPVVATVWLKRKLLTGYEEKEQERELHEFPYNKQRRLFLQRGVIVLTGITFTGTVYGTFRRDNFEIVNQTIGIKNLPAEFQGFTITHIADIHSGVFMSKERMQEYAQVVNSLGSDLIVVPGDFVTTQVEEVYPFAEAFSGLNARHGVFGVLGNHDFYTRDVTTVAKEVNGCGITLLRNDTIKIERNGTAINLIGIDDISTHEQADMTINYALRNADATLPKILLCHRPYFFDVAERKGIALTLSGHTHGGQVVFFRAGRNVISPARMASPYVSGLYSLNESSLYVTRGIGTVGIPVRINCQPEITKITLIPA